jgi:SAM-dependent methyltransferase
VSHQQPLHPTRHTGRTAAHGLGVAARPQRDFPIVEGPQYHCQRSLRRNANCYTGTSNATPVLNHEVPAEVYLPQVFSEAEWRAGSRGNWFWLVDLPSQGFVVELSRGPSTNADLLTRRFETVQHFDLTSSGVLPLPIRDATADCVLLHRPWLDKPAPNVNDLLSECRRLLRPGGCLVLTLDHSRALGRSSVARWLPRAVVAAPSAVFQRWIRRQSQETSAPWPLNIVARRLSTAGFGEVRPYYAIPTIDAPHQLLPARGRAIAFHEAQHATGGVRSGFRWVVRCFGLEAALFPGFLLIAVR